MNMIDRMISVCFLRSFVILGVLVSSEAIFADDWPFFRGPHDDGISREKIDEVKLDSSNWRTLWTAEVGVGFSSVVTSADRAITVGNQDEQDTVYSFDVATGQQQWAFSYDAPLEDRDFEGGSTGTPTIAGEHVYVFARAGDLYCLDFASGKKIWHQQIVDLADVRIPGWGFGGAPLVHDDLILLSAGEAGVVVNKKTGDLVWASADKEAGYAAPRIFNDGGKTLGLFPSGRTFTAVDLATGEKVWQQRWLTTFGCNAADPIVIGDKIFLCSGYNRGCALLKASGADVETLWKSKLLQNQLHTSILREGFLYGLHGDMEAGPQLICMELATGDVRWVAEGLTPTAISATESTLLVMTAEGELAMVEINPERFTLSAVKPILDGKCWTKPTLSEGRVYCRSVDGKLVCVALEK